MPDDYGFTTAHLQAREWHQAAQDGAAEDLSSVVAVMLSEPVTRWLPPHWRGPYTRARAGAWIDEQDAEGPVLLVSERETHEPLGLVLLLEEPVHGGIDVRVGYLLAEAAWGKGYGSELLGGIVAWCEARGDVHSIIGGVADENGASIHLLEGQGFVRGAERSPGGELEYRFRLRD